MRYIVFRTPEGLVRHRATEHATLVCGRWRSSFPTTEEPPPDCVPCRPCEASDKPKREPRPPRPPKDSPGRWLRWPDAAEREAALAAHLIAGLSQKECAEAMGVAPRTLARYVAMALRDAGAMCREQWLYRRGRNDERAALDLPPADPRTIPLPTAPTRPAEPSPP